ncbi:MAG: fibronectin type III domain-containing protein, partial [Bacteroidales bacterium]|nr:fibronectin type III domain-containing protein [Bacteroidales bacterium]
MNNSIIKIICTAVMVVLCGVGLNAQELQKRSVMNMTLEKGDLQTISSEEMRQGNTFSRSGEEIPPKPSSPPSRGVIFFDGFEGSSVSSLPAGWFRTNLSTANPWNPINYMSGPSNFYPKTGNWMASNSYSGSAQARNAWMISPAIPLTSGVTYTIRFWVCMPGYYVPPTNEYDRMKVCIGQAQTVAGMTTGTGYTLWDSGTSTRYTTWTQKEITYTATATNNFYLGFHAYTLGGQGDFIVIDDIEVSTDTPPVTTPGCIVTPNVEVCYDSDCKAQLTWKEPCLKYSHDDDIVFGGIGGVAGEHMAAIRFTPSDLAARGVVSGQKITKVQLGIGSDISKITSAELRIWEGGTSLTNAGTLIYTQPITNYASFLPLGIVEINLTTPYTIDASKELRVGWRVETTGTGSSYPFGYEEGPAVPEKGTCLWNGAIWECYKAEYGWDDNHLIKVYTDHNYKYNVYRNAGEISHEQSPTSYFDNAFNAALDNIWGVTTVCTNGLESDPVEVELGNVHVNSMTADYNPVCKAQLSWDVKSDLFLELKGDNANSWTSGGGVKAKVTVMVNETSCGTFDGPTSGTIIMHKVQIPPGNVQLIWTAGGKPAEMSFRVYNWKKDKIFTCYRGYTPSTPGTFFSFTNTCPVDLYRDATLIASNVTTTSYLDADVDPNVGATWKVESCKTFKTAFLEDCEIDCDPPENLNVVYDADCNTATITWEAPVGGKKGSIAAPIAPKDFVGEFLPKNELPAGATRQNGKFTAIEMGIGSSVPASRGDIILSPGAFSMPCSSSGLMVYHDGPPNYQYITGTNGYGDVKFGYVFKGSSGDVVAVKAWLLATWSGAAESIYAELWSLNSNDLPATLLGTSQPISTASISGVATTEYTFTFASPITVPANFAAVIKVPEYRPSPPYETGIAVATSEQFCYAPGTEKYSIVYNLNWGWEPMNEAWGFDPSGLFDLAIFPVLQVDEPHYNVYCDGVLITPPGGITDLTWIDDNFDPTLGHTWSVTLICGDEESDPIELTKEACEDCNPPENLDVVYDADCNTATITWDAPTGSGKSSIVPVDDTVNDNIVKTSVPNIMPVPNITREPLEGITLPIRDAQMMTLSDEGNFQEIFFFDEVEINTDPDRGGTRNAAWMTWMNDPVALAIGVDDYEIGWYQRFAGSDLGAYIGQYLTKIKYKPNSGGTVFPVAPRIRVYVGGSVVAGVYNPGTLVADVVAGDYVVNYYNFVELPNPILITGSQEIWFGVVYPVNAGTPLTVTDPAGTPSYIEGKSNVMWVNTMGWNTSTYFFPGIDNKFCWDLAAYTRDPLPKKTCDITVEMEGLYSNGWVEGYLSFLDESNTEWDRITLNYNPPGGKTMTVTLPQGVDIHCHWTRGFNNGQPDGSIGFTIKDIKGNTIYKCNIGEFAGKPTGVFHTFTNDACKPHYNVYCDGVLITPPGGTTDLTWIDDNFDPTEGHIWSVTLICPTGESEPIELTKEACEDCNPATDIALTFTVDCEAQITWLPPATAKKGYMLDGTDPNSPSKFQLNNPAGLQYYGDKHGILEPTGGEWINGKWYCLSNSATDKNIYEVDRITGVCTPTGITHTVTKPYGMALNPTNGIVYVHNENNLYRVDITTGATTFVTDITLNGGRVVSMVFTNNGRCIMLDIDKSAFMELNIGSGALTHVADCGVNAGNYSQDLAIDRKTNTIYWPYFSPTLGVTTKLYRLDLGCVNTVTYVGDFGTRIQGVGFVIPTSTNTTLYNVYRDGTLISPIGGIPQICFIDDDFDNTEGHLWEVTVICEDEESTPISVSVTVPPAPVATAATEVECTSFQANWQAVTGATGYLLTVHDGTTTPILDDVKTTNIFYSVTGLTPGVTYYYYVKAVKDCIISAESNEIVVEPLQYDVTPSAGTGGGILPNTVQTVDCGTDIIFDADPDDCKEVDEWT